MLFVQLDVNEVNLHFLGIRYTQNELVKKFGSMNNGLHQNSFISFSKNMIDFCVWKLIVNQDVYKDLVLKNQTPEHVDFFPLYRFSSDLSMVKK